jgi:hypothetical protein
MEKLFFSKLKGSVVKIGIVTLALTYVYKRNKKELLLIPSKVERCIAENKFSDFFYIRPSLFLRNLIASKAQLHLELL